MSGCALNFMTKEDPKGLNSWVWFSSNKETGAVDFQLILNGVKGETYSMPESQVGLFVDSFISWTGRDKTYGVK